MKILDTPLAGWATAELYAAPAAAVSSSRPSWANSPLKSWAARSSQDKPWEVPGLRPCSKPGAPKRKSQVAAIVLHISLCSVISVGHLAIEVDSRAQGTTTLESQVDEPPDTSLPRMPRGRSLFRGPPGGLSRLRGFGDPVLGGLP